MKHDLRRLSRGRRKKRRKAKSHGMSRLRFFPSAFDLKIIRGERKEQLAKSMAAKQQKRSDNIAMRHERRKNGIKKASKGRPGFEGKSFGKKPKKK
jgi:hypothetical protein